MYRKTVLKGTVIGCMLTESLYGFDTSASEFFLTILCNQGIGSVEVLMLETNESEKLKDTLTIINNAVYARGLVAK